LQKKEKQLNALYKNIPIPVYTWKRAGEDFILEDCSDAAVMITQHKIEDLIGIKAKEFYNDVPEIYDGIIRCFAEKRTIEREIQYQLKATDERKFLSVKYTFIAPDLVLEYADDITEKKTLQAAAIRIGHLVSLGELSAGVAHEINNSIHGVINYAQMLKGRCCEKGEDNDIPGRIIKEGERVATIVKNLFYFARSRKEEHSPVHIKDILSDALGLVETRIIKNGIKISIDFPSELPMIKARRHEIQQVFLNILNNAQYALNRKFQVTHENKIIEIKGEVIEFEGQKHVRTTFYDRGTGISEDILDKIGDPFFSTKPQDEGAGLGLSISHDILKNHGGRLLFESVEGEYTKVMVDILVDNGLE
jgi:C4-dicarboxylate-specific signal transduction histidine kinase